MNKRPDLGAQFGRRLTLLVTNAIKLGGLALAMNEVFSRPDPRALELIAAMFMMAGAQISEEVLLGIASKFFGLERRSRKEDGKEGQEKTPPP